MINVCVANLGKYNEGELVCQWLTLPATEEEIQEVFNIIGINKEYEEYFLSDWESDFEVRILEYSNIEDLNELAEELEKNEYRKEELIALMETEGYTITEAIENIDNHSFIDLNSYSCIFSEEKKLAYSLEDELGLENLVSNAENYFDYKKFGRELSWDLDNIIDDWDLDEEEKNEIIEKTDSELAEWWIYDIIGGVEELGQETIKNYIDYQALGRDLMFDYSISSNGIAVSKY